LKITKLLFFVLFISQFSFSQAFRKYSNEFLNLGVDAAAFGMGKAIIATSNDVNSIYWNPAGLVNVKDYQGSLMHASYFEGIANYDYVGFAMPLESNSSLGISLIRFGVDDILNTTELIDNQGNINYNNINLFSATDYAITIGVGKSLLSKNITIGVNGKIVHRTIGNFADSWGFGLDAGLQFSKNDWNFGLMIRDITTTFNAWSINKTEFDKIKNAIPNQNQELPQTLELTKPKAQFGVAKHFELTRNFNLLSEIDLGLRFSKTNDIISSSFVSISPSIGIQVDYSKIVFLRMGVTNFQNEKNFDGSKSLILEPNFGVGFNYKGIQIDYALSNIGGASGTLFSNIFSIKLNFAYFR